MEDKIDSSSKKSLEDSVVNNNQSNKPNGNCNENTGHNNNNEKVGLKKIKSPEKVDIKEEPKDDIKNYAEDTMNELLGWYGYGNEALSRVTEQLRRKRSCSDAPPSVERVNIAVADSDDESSQISGKSQANSTLDVMPTLPREVNDITATEVKADEPTFVVCSWCQKGKSLEKQYVLLTSEGRRKFCSEQCFDQCRREKYRKHKICDWCKESCGSGNIVEFEDGDGLYLFCSEDCLNKYKMNIFCQETQEHIKALQTEGNFKVSSTPPTSSSSSEQIIITPDLWSDENKGPATTKRDKNSSCIMFPDVACNSDKHTRDTVVSQSATLSRETLIEHKPNRQSRPVAPLRTKTETESQRHTRSSNQRPPRMTDREKIKQIRLRDNLPLYTPLRETCRSNSETFSIASLTSKHSPAISSSPPMSSGTPNVAAGLYTPASSSQLLGALTGTGSLYSGMHSPQMKDKDKSRDGCTSTDSSSSQSISPRTSTQSLNTPIPPLYPPPNPFTHTPIPSYFNNPSFPFPVPPALSMYGGLYGHSPLLSPLTSPMSSIMPPNTLMMPYPFVLPLPIPLPIPIPVPEKFMDELKKSSSKPDEKSPVKTELETNDDKNGTTENNERVKILNSPRENGGITNNEGRNTAEKSKVSAMKETEKRYYIDLDPASHVISSSDTENEVMDLSTSDTGRARSRSRSPVLPSASTTSHGHPKEGSTILVIQPDDSRLTPPKSPFHASGSGSVNQKYSSRRNLILDAPNVQRESSRSPSPEKRNYNGPSVRDILYGKRKCVRQRVKTK